jgi:uncharacterized DUF497 family protein
MRFEFDAVKSAANKAKHGIDFVEAQALWSDLDRLEIPALSTNEPRHQVIGQITQTTWSATVTYRHEETIRLISVRRARANEKRQGTLEPKTVSAEEFDVLHDAGVDLAPDPWTSHGPAVPRAKCNASTSTSPWTCFVRSIEKPGASASRARPSSSCGFRIR